jgi:hypothetical protein
MYFLRMIRIISIIFFFVTIVNQSLAQKVEEQLVKNLWGEVNEHMTEHRGKAGLVLLNFNTNSTFQAFENTCTGDNILQIGNWKLIKDTLFFEVIETRKYVENSTIKGKILPDKKKGKTSYEIIKITNNELVLQNRTTTQELSFKISNYSYMPKD